MKEEKDRFFLIRVKTAHVLREPNTDHIETMHGKKVYLAQPHTFWMLFLPKQMEM